MNNFNKKTKIPVVKKSLFTPIDLKSITYTGLSRLYLHQYRLIANNIYQIPKRNILRDRKSRRNFKKKKNTFFQPKKLKKRLNRRKKLFLKSSTSFNNFVYQYRFIAEYRSIFIFRNRYRRSQKWFEDFKKSIGPNKYKPSNPLYEKYVRVYQRKKFWRTKRSTTKTFRWLIHLVFKAKLYRLLRNRSIKRVKNSWAARKNEYIRWWLQLVKSKRCRPAKNLMVRKDVLFRRYLVLPYVCFSKTKHLRAKSTRFRVLVKKLRRSHKVSEGNYIRAYFENKLKLVALYLNYAPTSYISHEISQKKNFCVSNQQSCTTRWNNQNTSLREINYPEISLIKAEFLRLTNSISLNHQYFFPKNFNIVESLISKNAIRFNGQFEPSSNYLVKLEEIVHANKNLKAYQQLFFFKKLRYKTVPLFYKLNATKNAALMSHEFRSHEFHRRSRMTQNQWDAATLHNRK